MATALALGACRSRAKEGAEAGAAATTSAAPSAGLAAAPAASCEGPEFAFGEQDRLAWAARGVLRRRGPVFVVDLGAETTFSSTKLGNLKTALVTLACADCDDGNWQAFEAGLDSLVGSRVNARGIIRPAWAVARDGGVATDAGTIQLSTRLADVMVLRATGDVPASTLVRQLGVSPTGEDSDRARDAGPTTSRPSASHDGGESPSPTKPAR
ncbi:MAG: hypothetical protein KF764_09415 [Labilithrix sp.]|nr:hypothetical protein [Labilithrix sp.]